MSARARFWLPLLWAVKMEGLVLEGRGRLVAVVVVASRAERVDVKAVLVEGLMEVGLEDRGRGRP